MTDRNLPELHLMMGLTCLEHVCAVFCVEASFARVALI